MSTRDRELLVDLLLCGLVLWGYRAVVGHDFVSLDDATFVTRNPMVNRGLGLEGIGWAFTAVHSSNWIPLTWLSHMLDVSLFGLDAAGHHAVNAALHAVNACLLFAVLKRITAGASRAGEAVDAFWPAVVVAALFAVHPTRVESVAWVSERKDVLSTLFGLLALLAYHGFVQRPSRGRMALVGAALLLGLLAKPMLVSLPVLLLLLDVWPLRRIPTAGGVARIGPALRRVSVEKLPLFALVAAVAAVTFFAQRAGGAMQSLEALALSERLAAVPLAYVRYLGMLIWPRDLACLYPRPDFSAGSLAWQLPAALCLLAGITALAWRYRIRAPVLLVGWLWFAVSLLPVIGLVQVGEQWVADRYLYLPAVGLFLAAAWASAAQAVRWRGGPRLWLGAWGLVIAGCAAATPPQVAHWRDSIALWSRAVAVTASNATAHDQLGAALFEARRVEEAAAQGQLAVELRPESARARHNLANALLAGGRRQQAKFQLLRALALDPDLAASHWSLGDLLLQDGQPEFATPHFAAAFAGEPTLADTKLLRQRYALALERQIAARGGDFEAALGAYRAALAIADWPGLERKLAWALATDPRAQPAHHREALERAQRVASQAAANALRLDTLAAAHAANGDFAAAVSEAERALAIAAQREQAALAGAIEARLRGYRQRRPHHEPAR